MNAWRDIGCGMVAIGILVTAGFWVAQHPEIAGSRIPEVASANTSPDRIISAKRAAWLPQGDRLLTLTSGGANSSNRLILHNLTGGEPELNVEFDGEMVSTVSISPDGRFALIGTSNGRLWWLNLDSSEQTLLVTVRSSISAAAISHSGRVAAVADHLGRVFLCPISANQTSSAISSELEIVGATDGSESNLLIVAQNLGTSSRDIRFSESDDQLLWSGNDGSIRLWDLPAGNLRQTFRGCRNIVTAAEFLPGNDRIVSACLDDTIRIWDVASGRETWRGQFGCLGVNTLALSPNGKKAAWGGFSGKIHLWNVEEGDMARVIDSPVATIWDLRFSPDGSSLAAAGKEGKVRVYDVATGAQQHEIEVDVI